MKSILVIIFLSFPFLAVYPLTLEESIKNAWLQSEILLEQQEVLLQQNEKKRQQGSTFLPQISYNYSETRIDNSDVALALRSSYLEKQYTSKLQLTHSLFEGGRDLFLYRQQQLLVDSQSENIKLQRMNVAFEVAQAFFQVVYLRDDLKNIIEQENLYLEREKELQKRVSIGRSRETELLSVRYLRISLSAQKEEAQNKLIAAENNLRRLTHKEELGEVIDSYKLPDTILDFLSYQKQIYERPDLLAQQKKIDAFDLGIKSQKSLHLPTIDLVGNYYLSRTGGQKDIPWDIQLVLNIPIFSGLSTISKVSESVGIKAQNLYTYKKMERTLFLELENLHQSLLTQMLQLKKYQEAMNVAEKVYVLQKRDYQLGVVSNLDVLQAMTSLLDAKRSYHKNYYALKTDHFRFINSFKKGEL